MQPAKVMQPDGDLERRKAALSVQQRAALRERILRGKSGSHSSVPRVSNSATPPLSFAQERIWLHEQLVPQSVVYNRPANIRLRGPLQVDPLIRALRHAVSRHESIWMTVEASTITPSSKVQPPYDFDIPFSDLTHESDGAGRVPELVKAEAVRPFDLNQVPLLRSHLLRLGDDDHLLLLTFHHFCFDAWSQAVLLREFAAAYQAFVNNEQPALIAPVIRYSDFAAWDRSTERVHALSRGRSYWKRELQAPPTLQLPTDHSRLTVPSEAAGHVNFELKPPLVQTIQALAQSEGTTFFAVTLAAWQTLLYRYSGESDLVIGCPFAGRNRVESEELIGVFINTLPLRARISDGDTFRQLLRRTGVTVLAGLEHQEVPLQFIVQDILTDRDASGSPLFQAMFIHERFSIEARTSAGVIFEPEDGPAAATMVDLSLEIMESAVSVTGRLNYRLELWDHSTIERMTGHFVKLLEGIVADPDQRVSELPLLTEPERHQLLVEWNDTAVEYPRDKCVHELFEEQVARTPDAVAGIFEEQELTYRELNERANQLAHHLIALGVGPETLVGLCLERSAELVVAILGILKAGGAYVPLDADLPQQRLEFMLRDSAVRYLVTQSSLLDRLPSHGCCVTCLDNEAETLKASDCSNLSSGVGADNLAYVMYTSGSTGVPKGVAIPQSAVVNFLLSMAVQPGMSSDDRLLSVTTPTFDISVLELLLPLTVGASLDVVPAPLNADGIGLADYVSKRNATVMQATPATWQMMLHSGWKGCPDLKVLCGGEALSDHLADELQQRCRQLWNMYGPTETTIWSTTRLVAGEGACGSIGRPIANTQVYVLDEHRQPLPIGVPGELYIGGAGLARGYLNRSELTAEKFVTNPFSEDADLRLYRTGDLCCWRSDGNLEFIGRIDDQVKLRGYRIELGEIEAAMNEHPLVAQCVVILREDRPGDKRLVAYCVAASDSEPKFSELRSYLQQRLPDYMLPSAFVSLDTLPLTSSGKVNRRGLPAPDDSRPELETGYVVPRNPLEEQLAAIWCEVLQLERVGVHDNFFALGGHSLLVARMVGLIDRHCRMQISIALVFRNPTIAELACCLDSSVTQQSVSLATESKFLRVLRQGKGTATLVCLGVPNGHLMLQLTQDLTILQLNTEPHLQWGIEQFADAFALEVERAAGSGPIIIVGYSYGGLNAFALAGRLRRRVGQPVELVMIEPSVPSWKHKLAHTPAESRTDRIGRHLGNLRAGGAKGWSTYMMEKVSWVVWRQKERWKRWLTIWKVKLNLPLKPGQKQFYNGSMYVRNIRNYSIENMPGDAHLLGSAEYIQKHKDFWQRAVGGECRTRLLTNNSHHLDILDPTKSNEWIGFLAELARSAKQ